MAKYTLDNVQDHPTLTPQLLRLAYREMCLCRTYVQRIVQECSKGNIKFAIWGSGEEIHSVAQAIAYHEVANKDAFGIVGHYRSEALLSMWSRLNGYNDFHLDHIRQQLSRVTDPWSGGRQMTCHFNNVSLGILPAQSSVGMQIGKAVGYAYGLKQKADDGLVVTAIGDGTMAEGDLHEGMHGGALLDLPMLLTINDNNIAISVNTDDGRGIRDLESYAKAFGFAYYTADGNDFLDVYTTAKAAAEYCQQKQRPALFWIQNLTRLNGHSNAGDYSFVFDQHDGVLDFGHALVDAGILEEQDIITRKEDGEGRGYFARHDLGGIGTEAFDDVCQVIEQAQGEPEPAYESVFEHIRPKFPESVEAPASGQQTVISLNGAIRAALRDIMSENPMTWLYGQDVAERGGVMQATMGLHQQFPNQVRDSPINEPLIVGAAAGFALHPGATALPEIQFADYSLNALHWLVHIGNTLWTSNGTVPLNVILRLPVEPLHGGAGYHSMCMEGFYASIPGLTIIAPTTSRDCYGLLRSAADYDGPVVVLESKGLYRMPLGDAFPDEPSDPKEISKLKRAIGFDGKIPDLPKDFRVPLGKAAVRKEGRDLTIVTWGRCTLTCERTIPQLQAAGIDVEMIDLRTIVPPDLETVLASVEKTRRLLVVHEDRVFSSLGREIQGSVVEAMLHNPVATKVVGQDAVPVIPQNVLLEDQIVVTPEKIISAAQILMGARVRFDEPTANGPTPAPAPQAPSKPPAPVVLWTPNRRFVS